MLFLICDDFLLFQLWLLQNTFELILLDCIFGLVIDMGIINGVVFYMTLGSQLFERCGIGGHLIVILHYHLFLLDHRHILLNLLLNSKSIFITLDNLNLSDPLVSSLQIQALLRFDRFRCVVLLVDILQNFGAVRYTRLKIRWRLGILLRINQELILPQTAMYFNLAF